MIKDELVNVRWNVSNKEHYIKLGYQFTKIKEVFQVSTLDLPKNSKVKVTVICDNCECGNTWKTRRAIAQEYCRECVFKRSEVAWKDDEISILIEYFSVTEDLLEIANRIGRTKNAVQLKASELGLKKTIRKKIIADDPFGFDAASVSGVMAMLFGVLLGDGWNSRSNRIINGKLACSKSGGVSGDREGLKNIIADIEALFPAIKLGEIETIPTESPKYGIKGVTNRINFPTALVNHLSLMGLPVGRRAEIPYLLPQWLMDGTNEVKGKMISGYFCAEGTCFSMQTNDMTFRASSFSITKRQSQEQNFNELIGQFSRLLKDLNIEFTIKIVETSTKDKNWKVTFSFANNYENFFRLIKVLDFRYSPYKGKAAKLIFAYYVAKAQIVHRRRLSGENTKFLADISILEEPYKSAVENIVTQFINGKYNKMLPSTFPRFSDFLNTSGLNLMSHNETGK